MRNFLSLIRSSKVTKRLLLTGGLSLSVVNLISCGATVNLDSVKGYYAKETTPPPVTKSKEESNKEDFAMYQHLPYCNPKKAVESGSKKSKAKVFKAPGSVQIQTPSIVTELQQGGRERGVSLIKTPILEKEEFEQVKAFLGDNAEKMSRSVLPAHTIFEKIYKRTFSFIMFDGCRGDDNASLISATAGTFWLLDYAHDQKSNKYKLFFATNTHVSDAISHDGEFDPANYKYDNDLSKDHNFVWYLGRTLNPHFGKATQVTRQGTTFYYGSQDKPYNLLNWRTAIEEAKIPNLWNRVMSKPKILFAAVDFMKPEASDQFQSLWLVHYEWLREFHDDSPNKLPELDKVHYYKDFAVVEMDIDMAVLEQALRENTTKPHALKEIKTFKKWIEESIEAVDLVNEESRTRNFTNKNNYSNKFWDYADNLVVHAYNMRQVSEYSNRSYDISYTSHYYQAGYPGTDHTAKIQDKFDSWANYFRHTNQNLWDANSLISEEGNAYKGTYPKFKSWQFLDFKERQLHGFGYSMFGYDGSGPGSSGSLTTNNEGLPVSIHWGASILEDLDTQSEIYYYDAIYDSFVQRFKVTEADIKLILNPHSGFFEYQHVPLYIHHAYDLIDGTDEAKFPFQATSYRGALRKNYPNGVFSNGDTSTALFEDYLSDAQ